MPLAASKEFPHALCVTTNPALRRTLRRTLLAAGSSVEFADEFTPEMAARAALVVIDHDGRRSSSAGHDIRALGHALGQALGHALGHADTSTVRSCGKFIIMGESLEDDEVVALLRGLPMNHVISDCDTVDETELVVTSVKLLSGDIFGLHKYLAWGSKIHEHLITNYAVKRRALAEVSTQAKEVGARRPMIAKIESVTDELLMNALYDAPAIRGDVSRKERIDQTTNDDIPREEAALLRYASDGRYFAVSVQDNFGELRKEAILDHLIRARAERGRPQTTDSPSGGAGLGLYLILSSVTRFIANIEPGRRTEVICLFDLRQKGRECNNVAQSLHIFKTDESFAHSCEQAGEDSNVNPATSPDQPGARSDDGE